MVHFASGLVSHIQNGYDDESIRLDLIRDYTCFGLQNGLNDSPQGTRSEI